MKFIAWCLSWTLFWIGHFLSKLVCNVDCFAWLYPVYNKLMTISYEIQDKYNIDGAWK